MDADLPVLYEHPDRQEPLFDALADRGLAAERLDLTEAVYAVDDPAPAPVAFNQASPSAVARLRQRAAPLARAMLEHLERRGARVLNGTDAWALETSKATQLAPLRDLDVDHPRTLVFNDPAAVRERADELHWPAPLKPEQGGSGARMRTVEDPALAALLDREPGLWAPDDLLLVQEELADDEAQGIAGLEYLDGELLYARRVVGGSFDLCPSETCNPEGAGGPSFHACPDVPPAAVETGRRIVEAAGLDVGRSSTSRRRPGDASSTASTPTRTCARRSRRPTAASTPSSGWPTSSSARCRPPERHRARSSRRRRRHFDPCRKGPLNGSLCRWDVTMRRALALTLSALMLTMAFAGAPALAGSHEDRGGEDRRPDDRMSPEERRQWAQEKRQQALDRAEKAGLFGQLSYDDGSIEGSFVQATLDEDAGTLSDHAVTRGGTTHALLDEASTDADVNGSAGVRGQAVHLPLEDANLRVFDNPTGLVQVQAYEPLNATFDVADGYEAELTANDTRAKLTGDVDATILLAADGELTLDNGTVEAQLDEAGTVLVKVDPADPDERDRERALEHAAQEDRLGAQARLAGAAGHAVDQNVSVDAEVRGQYAADGQAIAEVEGDVEAGRVVHLTVAKDNLNVSNPQELTPKLDREAVPLAPGLDDVVNATGEDPVAHVAVREEVVEVAIWVPTFSLHSVNLQDATQDVADIPDPIDAPNPSGLDISLADQARQTALSQQQAWNQLPAGARAQAVAQAGAAGLYGQAELTDVGALQGSHVSAEVQADQGVIEDYAVQPRDTPGVLFERVEPASFTPAADPAETGPSVALPGEEVSLEVHDTPTGHLEVEAGDEAVVVEMTTPSDASIDRVSPRILEVETALGTTAHVVLAAGNGEFLVEGDTIVANLGANAAVHAALEPGTEVPAQANLEERLRSLARGDLGAEVAVTAVDAGPVTDRIETGVQATTTDVGEASVTVEASSQNPDPRAVAMHLDPALVNDTAPEDLEVLVDGEPVEAAAGAQAVLEASDAEATYHAETSGDGLQVLVNLDGFSEHDVTVQSEDASDDGDDGSTDDGSTDGGTTDGSTDDGTDGGTEDTPAVGVFAALATLGTAAVAARRS